jgi:hypothetical protein
MPSIGEPLRRHACQHGEHGPFATVVVGSVPPNISASHLTYEITGGGKGPWQVLYLPVRDGLHALFVEGAMRVAVQPMEEGGDVPRLHTELIADCRFEHAYLHVLQRRRPFLVTVEPDADAGWVGLFVEHVGTFGAAAWQNACVFDAGIGPSAPGS